MTNAPTSIPTFPCPKCGANLLEKGFYNFCNETVSLREDNYAYVQNGRLYVDHDEDNHQTMDHECQLDAHCRECDVELPWALYEVRDLNGFNVAEAPKAIQALLEKLESGEGV